MGFVNPSGEPINTVLLRHLGRQEFRLAEPFVYEREDQSATPREYLVEPSDLPMTDLASVPWFLRWFVPRYGRHTLPALLHDWQYDNEIVSREEADMIFNESLASSGVPLVRRNLMTAAVLLFTRLRSPIRAVGITLWFLAFLLGTWVVLNSVFDWWEPSWWQSWFGPVAALAPILGSALWGVHYRFGLWAGYGALIIAPPTAVIMLSQGAYWLIEQALPGGGEPIGTDEI